MAAAVRTGEGQIQRGSCRREICREVGLEMDVLRRKDAS